MKARVEEYVKKREAELSAKQYSEEEKKTQVDVQKRLANIGKFRERVSKRPQQGALCVLILVRNNAFSFEPMIKKADGIALIVFIQLL